MPRSSEYLTIIIPPALLVVMGIALADVIMMYASSIGVGVVTVTTVMPGSHSCPCCGIISSWRYTNTGFSSTITVIALDTVNGYVIHVPTPLVNLRTFTAGTLTMVINLSNYISTASVNGASIYPNLGAISLGVGATPFTRT